MAHRPQTRFGAPERSPGFALWRATLAWQRRIRQALAPHELTHVQFVLLASLWWLADHGDTEPTQADLAEQAGTDPMMTSQVLRKLEARGLLTRTQHPQDSRAHVIQLTGSGTTLLASALADVEATDQEYFAPLGDRGMGTFINALRRLA